MDQQIYQIALIVTAIINILMAGLLLRGSYHYHKYPDYLRTRMLTSLWMAVFGLGYLVHGFFQWRDVWPTAASALTVSYFHIGAICFCWGYIPLLDPTYLTQKKKVRDLIYFAVGLGIYWTVPLLWKHAPLFTLFSYFLFFLYAVYVAITFYRTYNKVSYRLIHLQVGNMTDFVRWMQMCCDLIVLFGISSVAITAMFPTSFWPYTLLLCAGVGMFAYMAYSVNKYGKVVEKATNILHQRRH